MALQESYQIILVDYVETACQLRKKLSTNVPLLGLAAGDSEEKRDAAERAEISFFMNKPFFVSRFKQAVAHRNGSWPWNRFCRNERCGSDFPNADYFFGYAGLSGGRDCFGF